MITVRVVNKGNITVNPSRLDNRLKVRLADWSPDAQKSLRPNDEVNKQIKEVKERVVKIYKAQEGEGLALTARSIIIELTTGNRPQLIKGKWGLPKPEYTLKVAQKLFARLTSQSPLDEAYEAYIAYLHTQKGTHNGLGKSSLSRWDRGLKMLRAYTQEAGTEMPLVSKMKLNWAKRHHTWLQSQDGGPRCLKPVSAGQASRFILKISNVLDWLIDDDMITNNPVGRGTWPKTPDKEVQYLEPVHIHKLLNLNWEGTQGIALWWFNLMCCTGLDYPDAVTYAKNRSKYEVKGCAGMKLIGKRKKPPHGEFVLPLLDEVNILFSQFPSTPIMITNTCINRYTEQMEKELGISWRITNKTARKTFGCLMLAAGHRIADVSLMLGHKRIETTERYYVKVRSESIDRAMRRVKVNISGLAKQSSGQDEEDDN